LDERSGFRGLLDLLHQAQREGWLRLHRDRKGVWRVFPAATPAPVQTAATPAEVETAVLPPPDLGVEIEPELGPEPPIHVETDVIWEPEELPEEIAEPPEPPSPPPVVEELVLVEPTPQAKARKPRASRAAAKSGKRKAPARRKAKEPAEPAP
jgi:protein TonB